MIKQFSRIWRDERGNAFIEMAVILPVFSSLLMGTVDISLAYSSRLALEQAAQRTIEKVQVNDFKSSDVTSLQSDAATAAGVSTGAVTVDPWLECDGARQGSYDGTCNAGALMTRYVQITINKSYTPMFTSAIFATASGGTVPLKAIAGIRTQ